MQQIVIIGCGIVGASIAYELSQFSQLRVTVLDRQPPAQEATGAALGVLMGIISQKTKGRAWALRQASMQRYETLIPELEGITGHSIAWNQQGILKLLFEADDRAKWERLAALRHAQGWRLDVWDIEQLRSHCPQIQNPRVKGAIYSPDDRQINPTQLTLALVAAAQAKGVSFQFDAEVLPLPFGDPSHPAALTRIPLQTQTLSADWVIITAGLGSTKLTQHLEQPIALQPVLGQAIRAKLPQIMGNPNFQPVITGEDIHLVPLGAGEYWVGATVEFPSEADQAEQSPNLKLPELKPSELKPSELEPTLATDRLETVWQSAIHLCPTLAHAKILSRWSGIRPRPMNQPAPIIEPMTGYTNVLLATGHYRNGVLLAPATAQRVRSMVLEC